MRLPPLRLLGERAQERREEPVGAVDRPTCKLVPKATPPLELDRPAERTVDRRANNGNGNDNGKGNGNGKGNNGNANGIANGNDNGNGNNAAASSATTSGAAPITSLGSAATPNPVSESSNGGGVAATPAVNGGTPTSAGNVGGGTPTQASTNGGGNAGGNGDSSQGSGNSPPAVQGQSTNPQPTTGPAAAGTTHAPATTQKGSSPTLVAGTPSAITTSSAFTGNGGSSTNWDGLSGGDRASSESGTIGKGGSADAGRNNEGGIGGSNGSTGDSRPSSMPAIVGSLVAVMVLLLLLLSLLLYKYRYKSRVQAFFARFAPFRRAPYTQMEKKRSSISEGLLVSHYSDGDSLMASNRSSALLAATSTHDSHGDSFMASNRSSAIFTATSTHASHRDSLMTSNRSIALLAATSTPQLVPVATTTVSNRCISPLQVSPLSLTFPPSPRLTASLCARRTSLDSLLSTASAGSSGLFPHSRLPLSTHNNHNNHNGISRRWSQDSQNSGVSIASSGISSPSLRSWPMPPQSSSPRAVSVAAASPPATTASTRQSLKGLAERYKPLTPTRVRPPLSVMPPLEPFLARPLPVMPAQGWGRGEKGGLS